MGVLVIIALTLVAPLAGAWIEIDYRLFCENSICVAPLAGAWIEMFMAYGCVDIVRSLHSRERGLKYVLHLTLSVLSWSLHSRERGLK